MIYYDNAAGFWRWDRWNVGSGTWIAEWLVRGFHKTGEEQISEDDIWRLVETQPT